MGSLGSLTQNGEGVIGRSMKDLRLATLERLHPARMVASPQLCRWSPLSLASLDLYTLASPRDTKAHTIKAELSGRSNQIIQAKIQWPLSPMWWFE